jgi:hypothetical protein
MPAVVPDSVAKALSNSDPVPSELSDAEKAAFASLDAFYKKGAGYSAMMSTRPQTNTGTSSSRLYWENKDNVFNAMFNAKDISIPVGVTVFPGEICRAPRSWGEVLITSSFIGTRPSRREIGGVAVRR